jgi:hypothetical protein
VPHPPDDYDFARPLKVLRKRLNGVYREDLGFSGPTRRYVVMVALLVGLASVPTLAVLTTGSNEITGDGRTGAMDVPFLPPPVTGPVMPAPARPVPSPASSKPIPGYGKKPHPPRASRPANPAPEPSPAKGSRASSSGKNSRVHSSVREPRGSIGKRHVPRRGGSLAPSPIPVVPDLPAVPEEDVLPEPDLPNDFPAVPGLPDIPDVTGRAADDDSHEAEEPHKPDYPGRRACEKAVNDRRSADRPRHSRRSAVAERPHNARPSRILEQSHTDGNLNVVRRLLTESNSEENRRANRPYRGMHRAEHTNYPEERNASYDRSTRVGRHHADPNPDAHHSNRR